MKHSIKRIINKIVDLCLQKQIHCDINMEVFSVTIKHGSIMKRAYFYGYLYNKKSIVSNTTLLLSDLLKHVKSL